MNQRKPVSLYLTTAPAMRSSEFTATPAFAERVMRAFLLLFGLIVRPLPDEAR